MSRLGIFTTLVALELLTCNLQYSYKTVAESCKYRKVPVSKSVVMFQSDRFRKYEEERVDVLIPKTACGNKCCAREWCKLWCFDFSDNICIFSNIIITPSYEEMNENNVLSCYTTPIRDVVDSNTTFSLVPFPGHEGRNGVRLTDGIYKYKSLDECLLSKGPNAWFMADLGMMQTFSKIRFVSQWNHNALHLNNVTIRIGSSLNPLSNKVFGFYSGPAAEDEEIIVASDEPVTARVISFQKADEEFLQICHFQVY
ncbi:uncharacterized protein [Palaemon carinicauda]|uniref:uncharacterized protein n=1 Tax=Palaemon carinicauda TaxID=392227 RepID=UPI0035B67DF8